MELNFDKYDGISGVYVFKKKNGKYCICQNTNIKSGLVGITKYDKEIDDIHILKTVENCFSSNYVLSAILTYYEEEYVKEYIKKFGELYISNYKMKYSNIIDIDSDEKLYAFKDCSKSNSYNICIALKHMDYNIEKFTEKYKDYNLRDIAMLDYYNADSTRNNYIKLIYNKTNGVRRCEFYQYAINELYALEDKILKECDAISG